MATFALPDKATLTFKNVGPNRLTMIVYKAADKEPVESGPFDSPEAAYERVKTEYGPTAAAIIDLEDAHRELEALQDPIKFSGFVRQHSRGIQSRIKDALKLLRGEE